MELRLLGPVDLVAGGRTVPAGPPQRRAVLAALAVDAGRPVTAETLVDRVWGDEAPERARRALHAHVTRLRRLLDEAGAEPALPRSSGGYLLDVDPECVDLHRFRRLRDRARDRPDAEGALLLRQALDLWRGEPLAGVAGAWAARQREGWRREYLDAVPAWAASELATGNARAVIGPLTELVGEHPLLEPLVAVLMRAQYAVGRGADALDLYAATRRRLADELGAGPGADLQAVHRAVLRDELTASRESTPPLRPPRVVPAQLPRDVPGFAGRRAELARLDALLAPGPEPAPVVVGALAGTAGVGKTALAVHWAHRVRNRFPDGQLYVDLRGFDPHRPPLDPGEAVRGFLHALDVPPHRVPAEPEAQAALYRSCLADRRMLVVLDNARDAAQVRPLLPGAATCLVLVASRDRLAGLVAAVGARPLPLEPMPPGEARELLAGRLGRAAVTAEPDAVAEIVAHCAGLPIALAVVSGRAATGPERRLADLADELADADRRLAALSTGDDETDVGAVLSWSYAALAPPAARLFRLLGVPPGPDVSRAAAAGLAGVPPETADRLLAELTAASLLDERSPGRFACHDLLRAYAAHLAGQVDDGAGRGAAVERLLDHYLHTGYAASRLLRPTRPPIELAPARPDAYPLTPADHDAALAWFTAEHRTMLAAVDLAVRTGADRCAWQLAWTLDHYLDRQGHWHEWRTTQQAALAAARRLGDPAAEGQSERLVAQACVQLGEYAAAREHLDAALRIYRAAGDPGGAAETHYGLTMMWERMERYGEALDHARQALELYREAGDRDGEAFAGNAIGWLNAQLGHHGAAFAACREAAGIFRELGDETGEAHARDSMGYAQDRLGDHAEAIRCYREALGLFDALGDRFFAAGTLTRLGDSYLSAGDRAAAAAAWQRALAVLRDLDHPDAAGVRARLAALDTPDDPGSG